MKGPRDSEDFEALLARALEPGEISFSADEQAEIRETAEFIALLARELDPGEIAFEPEQRRDLAARLAGRAREEDLTAWALGELAEGRREILEERMAQSESLRGQGLAIRHFCHRVESLLPPIAAPGWWERRRLRRVFAAPGPRRRPLWLSAAALLALLLARLQVPENAAPPGEARPVAAQGPRDGVAAPSPAVPESGRVAGPATMPPASPTGVSREMGGAGSWIWIDAEPTGDHPFAFRAAPRWPALAAATVPADRALLESAEFKIRGATPVLGRRAASLDPGPGAGLLARLDGFEPVVGPHLINGTRDLVAAAVIGRENDLQPEGGTREPGTETAETGSLSLAQSQPYLLSALLRGPVSGRPARPRDDSGPWLSADFQAMDFSLPAGIGGVEADSWRIEAGMSWLLSPSLQAGVSVAGIDSRMEVPGFGTVDAGGAAFSWTVDWRKDGYRAALTHTLGTFDQDLRRRAGGMLYPAGQDATVQLLSLWLTREFEADGWTHGPVAGLEGSWGSLEGYQEPFAGGVGMAGRDFGLVTSLVGWQISGRIDTAAGEWMPHAVLGWRHRATLADAGMVQGGPAGNFVVPPVAPERDSFLLEGGLRWVPPGRALFIDAVSSSEWRDGGDSENSLLLKVGVKF